MCKTSKLSKDGFVADFIDPLHHTAASSRATVNLDGWVLSKEAAIATFWDSAKDCDVAVVEGAMGLFDSADDSTEHGSTAQIAKWLEAPIILVLDCSTIARSAAAVIKGYQSFDPDLSIPGVILNKVTSECQTRSLREAIERANMDTVVLGGLPRVRLSVVLLSTKLRQEPLKYE
jgi:cobyrinic acid a,c-diamide synthase